MKRRKANKVKLKSKIFIVKHYQELNDLQCKYTQLAITSNMLDEELVPKNNYFASSSLAIVNRENKKKKILQSRFWITIVIRFWWYFDWSPPLVVDAWPIWVADIWAQISSSGCTKSAPCIPQSELSSWEEEDTDPPISFQTWSGMRRQIRCKGIRMVGREQVGVGRSDVELR